MFDHHSNSNSLHTLTSKPARRYGFENWEQELQNEPQTNSSIRSILSEFCSRSTIHGVKHIIDYKRHWIERAWWAIAITASAIVCFWSIHDVWSNWRREPIIVAAETKSLPVNKIPFPAVTICPFTAFSTSKFNYSAAYRSLHKLDGNNSRDLTAIESKLMKLANQFCYEGSNQFFGFGNKYLDDDEDDLWNTINDIAPAFNETLINCNLFGKQIDCDKLFVARTSERGLCYTFNTLNAREMYTDAIPSKYFEETLNHPPSQWNPQNVYRDDVNSNESYPYRTYSADLRDSLTVVLKASKSDFNYLCSGGPQGFTASLHPPNEGAEMLKRFFYVPLQQTVLVSADPFRTRTIRSALENHLSIRQCYLETERQLHFYKQYTTHNCRMECLTNYTLAQCGCVKISMPRSVGTKVCGNGKIRCFRTADGDEFRTDVLPSCNCLEPCSYVGYNSHVSQIGYNFSQTHLANQLKFDSDNAMFSRLIVKFKDDQIKVVRKKDSLTYIEFLTKIGGMFSLFLGASIISFVELLYYVTLRLFFSYRQDQIPKFPYLP